MGLFSKIREGLKKTKEAIVYKLNKLFTGGVLNDEFYDELEEKYNGEIPDDAEQEFRNSVDKNKTSELSDEVTKNVDEFYMNALKNQGGKS